MNQGTTILAVLLLIFFTGCVSYMMMNNPPSYDIVLDSVERPSNAGDRYGPKEIMRKTESDGLIRYVYEDSLIQVGWLPNPSRFSFVLENKSAHSIKIIWDEAAYVDVAGSTHRVVHSGVKYIDRNNSQPATTVVRGAHIEDFILPTDNVFYVSGQYGGWRELDMFPYDYDLALDYEGKSVQVLLPLEVKGVVNEYVFTFIVTNVTVPTNHSSPRGSVNSERASSRLR